MRTAVHLWTLNLDEAMMWGLRRILRHGPRKWTLARRGALTQQPSPRICCWHYFGPGYFQRDAFAGGKGRSRRGTTPISLGAIFARILRDLPRKFCGFSI